MSPFHVLIGPNASGKSTFLDVLNFAGRLVSDGLDAAIEERTTSFHDLVWKRRVDGCFELAIEAAIPGDLCQKLPKERRWKTIRYEIRIGQSASSGGAAILQEAAILKPATKQQSSRQISFEFPADRPSPGTLASRKRHNFRTIVKKKEGGHDHFYSEVLGSSGKGWFPTIRLGPKKSALGSLPEDEATFPVTTWFRTFLTQGVEPIVLNSLAIRRASPPKQKRGFVPDGSNLPWVVNNLKKDEKYFARWLSHVKTALPDIVDIHTVEREDDRHRYLIIEYSGGLRVPSWMASDGTLRLLALTILAYVSEFKGVYLIEEPENGIHPRAIETLFQSLSSVYDAQILLASHSPVILNLAEPSQVLCFSKTSSGATDIVRGDRHPALRQWRGDVNLGSLLATGVLG